MGRGRPITEEDKKLVKRLYVEEGKNCAEIGRIMDRTVGTISSNLKKMGVEVLKKICKTSIF